jgi:hypothetical protein
MYLDPRGLFMLVVLVGVTGWVIRGLMSSWHRIQNHSTTGANLEDMEERLRKVESTTTSILLEVQTIREKERFMAKLQASATTREISSKIGSTSESDVSPLVTQNIPVIPRAKLPR